MEKILFFLNKIPLEEIIRTIQQAPDLQVERIKTREIIVHRSDTPPKKHEYRFNFTKSMSETLLRLRKKYFNMVVIDERQGTARQSINDFEERLIPFLQHIEREPNIDKRYSYSRIIVLLDKNRYLPDMAFELGQLQIGGYVINPFTQNCLLNKIDDVLYSNRKEGKRALCIAGGGVEGLLYELGVLRALNSLFKNCTVTDFDMFCGISSGAYLCALLANAIQPEEFIKAFEGESKIFKPITAATIYDLNFQEYASAIISFWTNLASLETLSPNVFSSILKSFPNGLCRGEKLRQFLKEQLNQAGLTDDFRKLTKELYIGATNMDTFQHVVFGAEGWRDVPISTAVRASSAMEPVYAPAQIGNDYYIDGAFTRTTNFELAIKKGANLVIIVDPVVPLKTDQPGYVMKKGGIFSTIQGVKGLIATRFERSYSFAKKKYPHVDFLVFKPQSEEMRLLSGSPMKLKIRLGIVALAFETTIKRIMADYDIFSTGLKKHGIELTKQVVKDEEKGIRRGDINTIKAILENSPEYGEQKTKKGSRYSDSRTSFHFNFLE